MGNNQSTPKLKPARVDEGGGTGEGGGQQAGDKWNQGEAVKASLFQPPEGYWATAKESLFQTWPLLFGQALDWYELSTYVFLMPQMKANFFSSGALTYAVLSLTFICRPLGAVIGGLVGDTNGRKKAAVLAVYGLGIGTVGQGLIPSRRWGENWGDIGSFLLVVLHAFQGMAAGFETSSSVFMTELGDKKTIGIRTTFLSSAVYAGISVAGLVTTATTLLLSTNAMNNWGWRVPYLLALFPAIYAARLRDGMEESPEYLKQVEEEELEAKNCGETAVSGATDAILGVFAEHPKQAAIAIIISSTSAVYWMVGPVFASKFLTNTLAVPQSQALLASNIAQIVSIFGSFFGGYLADTVGVGTCQLCSSIVCGVGMLPAYHLLISYPHNLFVHMCVFAGMGAMNSIGLPTVSFFIAEMFPSSSRQTAFGILYNVPLTFFGIATPAMLSLISEKFNYAPGVLLTSCSILQLLVLLAAFHSSRNGRLRLTHMRQEPYMP